MTADAPQAAPEPASHLHGTLAAGHFAITAEVVPPTGTQARLLLDKALPLRGLADAVNVTDGAGARAHMCSLAAAAILVDAGIEPILQVTCRDRNRIALQGDLMAGIRLEGKSGPFYTAAASRCHWRDRPARKSCVSAAKWG